MEVVGEPVDGCAVSGASALPGPRDETATVTVTGLVRHIPISFALDVLTYIEVVPIASVSGAIPIESIATFETHCEDVSAVYGTAIPLMKEKQLTGACSIGKTLDLNLTYVRRCGSAEGCSFLHHAVLDARDLIHRFASPHTDQPDLEDALMLANLSRAVSEQLDFMVRQVPHARWADGPSFEACLNRLNFLTPTDRFEVPVSAFVEYLSPATGTRWHVEIRGAMDCMHYPRDGPEGAPPIPYEFKVVSDLTTDHRLQVACYLALVTIECDRLELPCHNAFRLMNCRTGQIEEIRLVDPASSVGVLDVLVRNRFGPHALGEWEDVKRKAGVPPSTLGEQEEAL